jgi:hypothetical protein
MNRTASLPKGAIGRTVGAVMAICLFGAICAGSAHAYNEVHFWEAKPSSSQAGGHPDLQVHVGYNNRAGCSECSDGRDLITQMPTGFTGSPSELPQCTLADFGMNKCPSDTQVGVFGLFNFCEPCGLGPYNGETDPVALFAPVYNLPPHPYEAALLGFYAPIIEFTSQISINSRTESDYGLEVGSRNIFRLFAPPAVDIWLWGVPASPSHDLARFPTPVNQVCFGRANDQVNPPDFQGLPACHEATPSNAPPIPFLSNPTVCNASLTSTVELTFYDGAFSTAQSPWPVTSGCDQLSFSPSMGATPTTTQAETASGLETRIKVPQTQNPTVPTPSQIRATRVTLPPGFTLNSNAADGKSACTDVEAAFGTREEAKCPETSKIGTATLETTSLPGPISGGIYIGQPLPGDRYRLFLSADGFATHVKLAGVVHPDPATGRLKVSFEDLPQAPFQTFALHFFGSERGSLVTPTQCGEYPVETEFVPWDAALPNQISTTFFKIDSGPGGAPCPNGPRPFSPLVKAGVVDNTAGGQTDFGFRLTRNDGDQNVLSAEVKTPPGLLASLRQIPYCPDSAVAQLSHSDYSGAAERTSSLCPPASRIGSVTTGTGAGTRPLFSSGLAYLAGPYKGAPLSFAFVIPAVSGPYDLGNVMVRAAVYVDPVTAEATTVTDPLPQILDGIPLRVRLVQVELDRPGFIRNPTDCDPFSVAMHIGGDEGARADSNSHFQVANCANLGFRPRFGLKLSGGLGRRGHPTILATVRSAPGEANLSSVSLTMPHGELLDNSHIGAVCTRVDFARQSCPEKSLVGTAEAISPLLDQPLRGDVYLRSSSERLPEIAIRLRGQIEVVVTGRVDAVRGALKTTFATIPDAPISSFHLRLQGGAKGLLINEESLCGGKKRAILRMAGQNGATLHRRVKLNAACGNQADAGKARRRPKGGR